MDPKIVPEELKHLDNTLSMYNSVRVCLFCSQYFDPDYHDGIILPSRQLDKVGTYNRIYMTVTLTISISASRTPYCRNR
jgi:hypothetical protein